MNAPRPATPRGPEAARAWRELVDLAIVHTSTVKRGAEIDRFELQGFLRLIIILQRTPFQLEFASATACAAAFLRLASAFALAGRPEDREAVGEFLAEGARCLDRLLALESQRAMARVTGDHD